MRFDRRRTYPLFDKNDTSNTGILTNVIAEETIVPVRVGGVIKSNRTLKSGGLPVNRSVSILTHPYLYKIAAGKMNKGGTSRFFGSRR